jgi:hypothetical protein
LVGAAFGAYGISKSMMCNFRKKNDGWNEFTGGASAGLLWGVFSIYINPYIADNQDVGQLPIS